MTHSPFLAGRQRKLAAQAAGASTPSTLAEPDPKTAAGQEYATLRAVLEDNLRKLQDVASHEARLPMKREFMTHFSPWVSGVLQADQPVQDEILLTCMVWAIDIGEVGGALEIGRFALKHGLTMPERYNRTVACFLREDIAEIALKDADAVAHELLVEVDELTATGDMPDQAKAKLNKALGRSWAGKAEAFDPADETGPAGGAAAFAAEAVAQFKRALELNKKAGVVKDLERAGKMLRDLTPGKDEGNEK